MPVPKNKTLGDSKSVAIVGGGISGLSVAYKLIHNKFDGKITVVEKSPTLGGNAATAEVVLGTDFRSDGLLQDFVRIADLGVNDVNLNSYIELRKAMIEIDYPIDEFLRPLEDTVAYFTPDFEEIWTKDGYLTGQAQPYKNVRIDDRRGVVDVSNSLQGQLATDEHTFMKIAAEDFKSKSELETPIYWNFSVEEYVNYFAKFRLPKTDISEENFERIVRLFLYPRISAMYFADPAGPENMPMLGVMSYYRLQEGIGIESKNNQQEIDRRYFTKGSQHWINALADWLQTKQVEIIRDFDAAVIASEGRVKIINVSDPESERGHFFVDQVVMATHADEQLTSFESAVSDEKLLCPTMAEKLRSIRYAYSHAYAHTWSRLLPPNPGTWRTYNVMIRTKDPTKLEPIPYQMTYVQNRHRSDRHHPDYQQFGMPIYFVSLNPKEQIPDEYILRRTSEDEQVAIKEQAGYSSKLNAKNPRPELATATFRHTIMTKNLLEIQSNLQSKQGMANGRVFFAGCWTNGAGLHEECFDQADKVVEKMLRNED